MKLHSLLVMIPCFLIFSTARAQNTAQAQTSSNTASASQGSLRDQALTENIVKEKDLKKSKTSSDAQLGSGMLSLKDPRTEVITRSWKYFLDLSLQEFHPEGTSQNSVRTNFDLNNNSTTVMPAIAFGFAIPTFENDKILSSFGLSAKIGYASQDGRYAYASGEETVRLNSMITSLKPYLGFRLPRLAWVEADLGLEYGSLNYVQSSATDISSFSQAANFGGWNAGLVFDISSTIAITTQYSNLRTLNSSDTIAIQKHNFELGTRITW